jgi:glutamyl-tRNA synthetase
MADALKKELRTRFAPSPTGRLHIGGARTALFSWLCARHGGGSFHLRIEDTDAQRSSEEYTRDILESLEWLGLGHDGEVEFQSRRREVYEACRQQLLDSGKAYWCHCSPERLEEVRARALSAKEKPRYDGRCRELGLGPAPGAVLRFRGPADGETAWSDLIKGPLSFLNHELDDLVLFRADGLPTYNMAVVADDSEMGISCVIRGDDHVNNTPRQILLYEALGADIPEFAHVPMILGPDKKRLSKRHGAESVLAYRELGYLPQALVNCLARLGWSHGDQEIFSLGELTSLFTLNMVGKSAAVFNLDKLGWLNGHYLKELPAAELGERLIPFLRGLGASPEPGEFLTRAAETVRERGRTLKEMAEKAAFYFTGLPELSPKDAAKLLDQSGKKSIGEFLAALPGIKTHEGFDRWLTESSAARGLKKGAQAQPLRLALTGGTASPGLFDIIDILGPEKVRARLEAALSWRGAERP